MSAMKNYALTQTSIGGVFFALSLVVQVAVLHPAKSYAENKEHAASIEQHDTHGEYEDNSKQAEHSVGHKEEHAEKREGHIKHKKLEDEHVEEHNGSHGEEIAKHGAGHEAEHTEQEGVHDNDHGEKQGGHGGGHGGIYTAATTDVIGELALGFIAFVLIALTIGTYFEKKKHGGHHGTGHDNHDG